MARRSQRFVVDVQNVLHTVGELRRVLRQDVERARELLAELLRVLPEVYLAEDGGPAEEQQLAPGQWRLRAESGSADDAIISWLQRHPRARPVCVVTADGHLRDRARAQGARVVDPVAFWRRYVMPRRHRLGSAAASATASSAESPPPPDPAEVDMWLRYFAADDDEHS